MTILTFLQEKSLNYYENNTNLDEILINNTSTNTNSIDILNIEKLLNIEFLYLLLPCYFFLIVGIQRYFVVSIQPKDENTTQAIHKSYYIKKWLSKIMCLVYCIIFGYSQLGTAQHIWTAEYKFSSLLYLFGIFAWYLSGLVLEKEKEKDLPQEIYTHRLFWIGSFICSLYKLTLSYEVTIL